MFPPPNPVKFILCLTVQLSTAANLLPASFTQFMLVILFRGLTLTAADPGGRAVCGSSLAGIMGLIHARVWMSVVSVVCCQVEVSATS
jgi:hypothetical protein